MERIAWLLVAVALAASGCRSSPEKRGDPRIMTLRQIDEGTFGVSRYVDGTAHEVCYLLVVPVAAGVSVEHWVLKLPSAGGVPWVNPGSPGHDQVTLLYVKKPLYLEPGHVPVGTLAELIQYAVQQWGAGNHAYIEATCVTKS